MGKKYGQPCPVARTLELIGDRWTLLIVRDLLPGTRRFQDLLESLPGIAPNMLSDRLKLMEEHALITRHFYSEHPPRAGYELTAKGKELGIIVGALAAWGSRHVYRGARLVHGSCGHPVKLGYYCADCDERVRGAEVGLDRGGAAAGRRLARPPSERATGADRPGSRARRG